MVWGTKALPVRPIPEQRLVAAVRDLVVDHGCRCDLAIPQAVGTQRILSQERRSFLLPSVVVTALAAGLPGSPGFAIRGCQADARADGLHPGLERFQSHGTKQKARPLSLVRALGALVHLIDWDGVFRIFCGMSSDLLNVTDQPALSEPLVDGMPGLGFLGLEHLHDALVVGCDGIAIDAAQSSQ